MEFRRAGSRYILDMASVASEIVDTAVKHTMDLLSEQVGYLVHYKRNVNDLKTILSKMEDMKNDIQRTIDDNRKNLSDVDDRLLHWLSASDDMHEQVTHFLQDELKWNTHLKLKSRYVKSEKAIKLNRRVLVLLEEAMDFNSFNRLPVASVIRPDFQDFQSRRSIVNQALEALMDDELSIISIYGMPGSGKTTITHQLSEIIQVRGLFGAGKVLPVCVTRVPDVKRIQNELVNLLGLRLHAADPYFTSLELQERLADDDERKLLILDDVWEEVDLETIGIPSAGKANKLQILLTSHREDVCIRMGSQRNFLVPLLPLDEAWDFFRQKAFKGTESIYNQTDISALAKEIVNCCEGLPLAIATMATELKDKPIHVWSDALDRIRNSNWQGLPGMRQVFSRLEVSYDHLDEELKSCFLLCCLFPRDSNILIEDLIRYGMRLRLFEHVDNLLEASNRVRSLIYDLKRSFLLLEGDTDDSVKIHNVFRNFAIAVASRDKSYVCCDDEMIKLPEIDKLRSCTVMSFVCEEIDERPIFECPKLQFLLFVSRRSSQSLNCFFQGMKTGELGKLKILTIKTRSCPNLPEEIGLLTNLRLLDLGGMSGLKYVPPGVLLKLSNLEEIYVTPEFCGWGSRVKGEDVEAINASLSELELLPITNFEISVPKGSILPHLPFFKNLVRHESGLGNTLLTIGEVSEEDKLVLEGDTTNVEEDCALLEKVKDLRLVKVQKLKSIEQLMDTSKQITSPLDSQLQYFSNLRYLAIESCGYLKHMFPLYLCKMLSQLQKIRINDCIKMDGILYGKGQVDEVLLPYLTKLELISVPNLNSFWVDIDNAGSGGLLSDLSSEDDYRKGTSSSTQQLTTSEIEMESSLFSEIGGVEFNFVLFPSWIRLSNLEELRLHGCTLLRVAFTFTVAEHLVKLKTLEIRWCWKMEYIVATVGRPEGKDRRSNVPKPVFPKLTSFIVDDLPELMAFSSNSNFYLEWSSLEELKVSKCPKIKILASTLPPDWDITEDELLVSTNEILFKIPPQLEGSMNVKFLKVRLCDNLTHLFSTHAAKILTGLERMEIKYCEKMKEVVAEEEDEEEQYELSSLESVTFDGCFQLKRFSDKNSFSAPNLKELHINGSQYPLDGDFNSTIKKVMLSKLRISNMKQLVRIGRDQIPDEDSGEICDLEIEGCDKLLKAIPYNLIVRLQKLEKLAVMWCDSLEEIFDYNGAMEFEGQNVVAFSHLEEINLFDLESLKVVFTGIPRTMTGFRKLRKLCVHGCHSLTNIFSVSSVRGLLQLQELKISSCNGLKEIVAKDEKEEKSSRDIIVFPQLRSIEISNSATLESFYSGIYDLVMPLLESFHLNQCPSIKKLSHGSLTAPKLQKVQGDCKETSLIRSSPIADLDVIIAKKKKRTQLRIYNGKNLHDQLPYVDLSQIHELEIEACDELLCAIPCNLKPTDLQKLEMLVVMRCHLLEEIFEHRGASSGNGSITTFCNLEEIILLHLEKLQHVFSEIPKGTVCFQKLRKLHIHDCYNLRNIFTVSTIKGLSELEELKFSSCDELEEIVAEGKKEEQEFTDKIVFPQLKNIHISYSPKLVCFYSGNYGLGFPKLESIFLYKCPYMLTFSNGLLTTPSQLKVQIDNANYKLLEDGLNATMKYKDLLLQQDKNSQGLEEHQQGSEFASGSSTQMYNNTDRSSLSALVQENQMLKQKLASMERTIAKLLH